MTTSHQTTALMSTPVTSYSQPTPDSGQCTTWRNSIIQFFHTTAILNILHTVQPLAFREPVPVAARSKAYFCGRSPAEIAGSNPTEGTDVCCECCVLSCRGYCDELITRPEKSYRLWCVVVCALETSRMRRPWPTGGFCPQNKQRNRDNARFAFSQNAAICGLGDQREISHNEFRSETSRTSWSHSNTLYSPWS